MSQEFSTTIPWNERAIVFGQQIYVMDLLDQAFMRGIAESNTWDSEGNNVFLRVRNDEPFTHIIALFASNNPREVRPENIKIVDLRQQDY